MPRNVSAVIRQIEEGVEFVLQEAGKDPYRIEQYPSLEAALDDNPGYQWRLPDSNEGVKHAVLRVAQFLQ